MITRYQIHGINPRHTVTLGWDGVQKSYYGIVIDTFGIEGKPKDVGSGQILLTVPGGQYDSILTVNGLQAAMNNYVRIQVDMRTQLEKDFGT